MLLDRDLSYCDDSAAETLLQAHRAVRQAGGVIKLVHLCRRIALPLVFGTKLMVLFESFDDEAEAAARMRMTTNRLNEIVKGKRGVTADTAWRLSALLGTSPEVWMNLQMHWDLWHAAQAR